LTDSILEPEGSRCCPHWRSVFSSVFKELDADTCARQRSPLFPVSDSDDVGVLKRGLVRLADGVRTPNLMAGLSPEIDQVVGGLALSHEQVPTVQQGHGGQVGFGRYELPIGPEALLGGETSGLALAGRNAW
jgi:hypothetical protein